MKDHYVAIRQPTEHLTTDEYVEAFCVQLEAQGYRDLATGLRHAMKTPAVVIPQWPHIATPQPTPR